MNDLEREMQSILDVARRAHDPAPGDAARVRRALAVTLAGAAVTTAGSAAAATQVAAGGSVGTSAAGAGGAAAAGSASSLVSIAKFAAIGLLAGTSALGVGTVAVSVVDRHPAAVVEAPPERPRAAPEPRPARLPVPAAIEAPAEPAAEPEAASNRAAIAPSATERPRAQLQAEARALRRAQQALERDPARALEHLDAMQRAHPDGVLAEEALAARVFAYCQLGQRARARQVADRFLVAYPRSLHAARVRASCAMAASPVEPTTTKRDHGDGSTAVPTMDR